MNRRKLTPQQKKKMEYDDSRPWVEVPHSFRKCWPKNKARANRVTRQREEQTLKVATKNEKLDDISDKQLTKLLPKRRLFKSDIMTLRERVQRQLEFRVLVEAEAKENQNVSSKSESLPEAKQPKPPNKSLQRTRPRAARFARRPAARR